jgi:hypothetical protein
MAASGRWTATDSPVVLEGNLLVSAGVALTVDAGVRVDLNGYFIQVDGELRVEGTAASKVMFHSTIARDTDASRVHFTGTSVPWDEAASTGSVIDYAEITLSTDLGAVRITDASPRISNSIITNPGFDGVWIEGGAPLLTDNSIVGNRYRGVSSVVRLASSETL